MDWTVVRLKEVGRLRSGAGFPDEHQGSSSGAIPFFKVKALDRSSRWLDATEADDTVTPTLAQRLGATILEPGSVVFAKVGAALLLARFRILRQSSCADNNMMALTLRPGAIDQRYVWYALGLLDFAYIVNPGAVPSINASQIGLQSLPCPPRAQQGAITDFLDRETAKADALVVKYERLIQLLEEKRVALIAQAVTKGLDPSVPMKGSGVTWIGEIPDHWEVRKTKYVATLKTGHTPSRNRPEYWIECTIPWVTLTDVAPMRDGRLQYVEATNERISGIGLANSAAELLPANTVIVSRTASVGFSAITARPMATTQDFVNWICGLRLLPEYLLGVFRTMKPELSRLSNGSVHQTIYMPDVGKFVTPVPPLQEQQTIAEFIRKQNQLSFRVVDAVRKAIALVKERRSALITAAVTGQIHVRTYDADRVEVGA